MLSYGIYFLFMTTCVSVCRSQKTGGVDLCTQLQQMHQLCVGQCGSVSQSEALQGPPRPIGPAVEVDYYRINAKIDDMFAEYKILNDARIRQLEASLLNLQRSLTDECPKSTGEDSEVSEGLFTIHSGVQKAEVFCDVTTDGGGWIVFQRRMDGSVDFYRNWNEYVKGFGSKTGEFWLGLELLHKLTSDRAVELRIDLEDWEGNRRYAKYSTFHIGDATSGYKVNVGGYVGDAGDSMAYHNGMKFTTKDKDSDFFGTNCAITFKGAWWHKSCHHANLNGFYFKGGAHKSFADGLEWYKWKGHYYSMKFTEMKIRPIA